VLGEVRRSRSAQGLTLKVRASVATVRGVADNLARLRKVEQDLKSAAAIDTLELVEDAVTSVSVTFEDPPPPAPAPVEDVRP
jgi:hypothetical protein